MEGGVGSKPMEVGSEDGESPGAVLDDHAYVIGECSGGCAGWESGGELVICLDCISKFMYIFYHTF